jgi:hypothetical protein
MVHSIAEAQGASTSSGSNSSSGNTTTSGGSSGSNGTKLLRKALPLLIQEHTYWTSPPKQVVVQAADGSMHNFSRWVEGTVQYSTVQYSTVQ